MGFHSATSDNSVKLPQELVDYIILRFAEPEITIQLGSPFVQRLLMTCRNRDNPWHRCNNMCRFLRLKQLRGGEISTELAGGSLRELCNEVNGMKLPRDIIAEGELTLTWDLYLDTFWE